MYGRFWACSSAAGVFARHGLYNCHCSAILSWALSVAPSLCGGLVRLCLTHHVIWSVNSVCHTFGKRAFETPDRSRNEWVVGLLAFGEGWHNNHHAFPRSAFHGLRWWQVDLSSYVIWTLERVGSVKEVHRVRPAMLARRSASSNEANEQTPTSISPLKRSA